LHLHLGVLLKRNGNLDQSLHHLDEAAALDPHSAVANLERGRVFLARRQQALALAAFRQAAALAPQMAEPHYEAGLALKDAKDYSGAEAELRQAARLDPKERNIQKQLAAVIALNLVHHPETVGAEL
jgi:tetratricopeptide (TPR) repeat protein